MSRLLLVASLVASLTTSAFADRAAAPHFAQPPHTQQLSEPDVDPAGLLAPVMLDRATVRAALAHTRKTNLDAFRAYQKKGVFPSNTFKGQKLNVWRDEDGNFCAAATIIRQSGQTALVDRVADQSNFIRLADVRQGPLMDWMLTSGFTQEEIAAIQEPFMPVAKEPARPMIDAQLRKTEDARLRAKYTQVERDLVKQEAKSLELAVDRLMKHQQLAWQLVNSTLVDRG